VQSGDDAPHAAYAPGEFGITVSRNSRFLGSVSEGLLLKPGADSKRQLTQLARDLLNEPEILAVTFLDMHRRVITQASKPIPAYSAPFSLQMPILAQRRPIGWIRAWYSPGLALEEFWRMASDLVIVLLCGTLVLFVLVFLAINEWILTRPFRHLLEAIDATENTQGLLMIEVPQRGDEWGVLAQRLNRFLGNVKDLQEQSKILHETSRLLRAAMGVERGLRRNSHRDSPPLQPLLLCRVRTRCRQ